MGITHQFVSAIPDGADATLVKPSDWNATHVIALTDGDIPATIARDTEVTSAVSTHAAASDPHTGYQKESEKAAASGYASLDASTKVPLAQLPTGTTSTTVALGDAPASAVSAHTGTTSGAHAASAISVLDAAGNLAATNVETGLAEVLAFVGAKAYHNTTQAISAATMTACLLNSEEFDSDGFHDTVSNTSRMTIPAGKGGYYLISGSVYFSASPSAAIVVIRKNGTTTLRSDSLARATGSLNVQVTVVTNLVAGDYIELMAYSSNAISIGDASVAEQQNSLSVVRLGV